MNVRELYRQLKPFVEMCPDQEVTVAVLETGTMRIVYPQYLDRSDHGERCLVLTCGNGEIQEG